jgi:hypothetical protein
MSKLLFGGGGEKNEKENREGLKHGYPTIKLSYVSFSFIIDENPTETQITAFLQMIKDHGVANPVIYIKYDGKIFKIKRNAPTEGAGGTGEAKGADAAAGSGGGGGSGSGY